MSRWKIDKSLVSDCRQLPLPLWRAPKPCGMMLFGRSSGSMRMSSVSQGYIDMSFG